MTLVSHWCIQDNSLVMFLVANTLQDIQFGKYAVHEQLKKYPKGVGFSFISRKSLFFKVISLLLEEING